MFLYNNVYASNNASIMKQKIHLEKLEAKKSFVTRQFNGINM